MINKKRDRLEIGNRAAKRVLKSGDIVDVEGDHRIGPAGLEHLRHVFRRDRVARLRAPILPGIAKIGDNGGDALGTSILQRADEEQQSGEFVVGALIGP